MTAQPARRRKWPWTLAVLGLGGVLLIQTGGAVLRADWTERQLARAMETAIEYATGERAVIGDLEILPSRGRLEVEGLVLSHRSDDPDLDGAAILAVDHLGVPFRILQLDSWVGAVEIENPILRLHIDEDGLREFRDAEQPDARSFPWTSLSVTNGQVHLVHPDGGLSATGVTLSSGDGRNLYDLWIDDLKWNLGDLEQNATGVYIRQFQAAPDRVLVPRINIRSEDMWIEGDVAVIRDGPLGGNFSASLALSALDAVISPTVHMGGDLNLDVALSGTTNEPEAKGALLLEGLRVSAENHQGEPVLYEVERAVMKWRAVPELITVERGKIHWAEGLVEVAGTYDPGSTGVQAVVTLESVDLAEAVRQASGPANAWTTFTGDGEIHMGGTLDPLQTSGSFDLALADLWVGNGPIRDSQTERLLTVPTVRLTGQLDLNPDGIRIHARDLVGGATSGEVNAWIGFDWFGPLDIQVDLDRANLDTFRPLKGLDLQGHGQLYGRISGPFSDVKFVAGGRVNRFAMLGIQFADQVQTQFVCSDRTTLEFSEIRARTGHTLYQGDVDVVMSPATSLDIALQVTRGRAADLLRMVDADKGAFDGDVKGTIALTGAPYTLNGDIALELRDVTVLGERFAVGELYSWMDDGRYTLEALSLARQNGQEGVLLRGTVGKGWKTNLDLVATGFQLQRLDVLQPLDLPLRGNLSVDARIGGTIYDPEPHGRLAVRDSWYAGHAVPDSTIYFDTTRGVMQLEGHLLGQGMGFDGHLRISGAQDYRVMASLEQFPLHTILPQAMDGNPVEAWLSGEIVSEGALAGTDPIANVEAEGTALAIRWDRHRLDSAAPWRFTQKGRAISLEGLRLVGSATDLHLDGRTESDGRIHWDGGGSLDLDLARMGVPDLQRADGVAELRIFTGSPQEGLVVDLATCGATLQGDWFPHSIDEIYGIVRGTKDGYRLRSLAPGGVDAAWWSEARGLRHCGSRLTGAPALRASIGGGKAAIEGQIQASGWVPTHFDLTGMMMDGRVAFFDFLPAAVGDADLSFDGTVGEDLLLSGQIDINDMMFSQRIEWEDWLLEISDEWMDSAVAESEVALFAMDLAIRADRTVRMRNNVADLTASGDLRVVGDTANPGLVGDIRAMPGGRIHLKEREFELERGELRFVDPLAYDPDLDIVLRTDVRTREQNYDVEYRVLGTYEDWRAETSSEPQLASADINALLLFGMTRDELERYGGLGGALAVEGGDLLASKMFLSGGLGTDRGGLFRIVEPLRPDRLDLVSGVSERGSGILTSDLRLLYENELDDLNLPGTLMIFEQNLTRGSDTYLGLEQRLARTLFTRSYWASEQHGRHLAIGGAYGVEVKVRWELD